MKKILIILFFVLITGTIVFAQSNNVQSNNVQSVNVQPINLEQARLMALANSRSLARYEMAIRTSVLDERNQLYSMLPQVSADVRASMFYFRDWEFVNPADNFSLGASFSITQIIFQGGKSFIQRAISEIATESIRIDAMAEYFNVLDAIDNAYYAVLEAGAAMAAEEVSLEAAILGHSIAEIRHSGGIINQGDYLRALTEKESRQNSYNQARRNYALNMTRFRNLTGITETVELEPINFNVYEDIILYLAGISDEGSNELYSAVWDVMSNSNPSLAKAVLGNRRAQMNHSLTLRDYSPVISATIFSSSFNFIPGFNSDSHGGVTIRGSIPVDFWVMNNRIERSRIIRDSAALDFENAESSLEQELRNALSNIYIQAGAVISSRRSLEYSERHFEFVQERYRLSLSSVSDFYEVSSLLINSRNNLNRASYSFLQSLSRLRSLCAIDNEEELLRILLN